MPDGSAGSWHAWQPEPLYDAGPMDPETQRLISLLKVCLKILGVTNREVARRMGMSPSYISKLFSGASELRLDHVIRICRAADLDPAEFFALAYPRQPAAASPAAFKLRELLQNLQPPPRSSPRPAEPLSEDKLQGTLKETLEKMMGKSQE
jgi:transcriptional regulator with XRE-family HTH domain